MSVKNSVSLQRPKTTDYTHLLTSVILICPFFPSLTGYLNKMEIESTQPSTIKSNITDEGVTANLTSIVWTQEMSVNEAYSQMEKEFYPFKEVHFGLFY